MRKHSRGSQRRRRLLTTAARHLPSWSAGGAGVHKAFPQRCGSRHASGRGLSLCLVRSSVACLPINVLVQDLLENKAFCCPCMLMSLSRRMAATNARVTCVRRPYCSCFLHAGAGES